MWWWERFIHKIRLFSKHLKETGNRAWVWGKNIPGRGNMVLGLEHAKIVQGTARKPLKWQWERKIRSKWQQGEAIMISYIKVIRLSFWMTLENLRIWPKGDKICFPKGNWDSYFLDLLMIKFNRIRVKGARKIMGPLSYAR